MNDLALPAPGRDSGVDDTCLFGLSLCSGAGGIDLGLTLALPGYRTVGHVERETYAAATLVARMADKALDQAIVWDDIATFDGKPWCGAVDIVSAGYPCQPFSVAGKRRGAEDPRHLWPHVARIIGEVEPPFVFLENVAHHLRLGFPEVAGGLVALGYRLAAGLFTAAEVGAPHRRERLFILAIREGDQLANPARLLWHSLERREPDGTPAPLADAKGQRQREPTDETDAIAGGWQAWDEPRHHGGAMADAAGDGWQQTERWQPQIGRSDPCGGHVDDPDGAGSQGWGDDAGEYAGERPPWPPGPDDADGWQRYLRSAPDAEPAIRRGADGLAQRVDRLRLCGNGVVPLVAAHALRTLAFQLLEGG
ncbi:DNA cytosine methyltransferase [Paracoccus tegillarcae]|uniref:DNA (cytosine-5-)-methyltransferase n=1 Tax=Paracoccus tegillarcae TaxID=1529068 RepID=A0A2K9EV31_9RHOB|nr:DNA cytosine methyltransferase [Paracoccus tegillarcae]AUH33114.1 DNA cytosine methyltransferase [Paracoccus tegillarcae]